MGGKYTALRQNTGGIVYYVPSRQPPFANDESERRTWNLRLVNEPTDVVSELRHRSGWPFVMGFLGALNRHPDGPATCLLDDFIEHRFCYHANPEPYGQPWIGICHHPPNLPEFANKNEHLHRVFASGVWQESQKTLVGLIALSEYAGRYLCESTGACVACLKHPTEVPELTWTPARFTSNRFRWLIQLGFYLRNTRILEQTPEVHGFRKIRLWPPIQREQTWIHEYDQRVADYWLQSRRRQSIGNVTDYPMVSPAQYDRLLSQNVIATEVFDASANNVIIECIARHTPLVVNRHPAVEEYLGGDYPLYFETPEEIPSLLSTDNILRSHEYLSALEKSWIEGAFFLRRVDEACQQLMTWSKINCRSECPGRSD